MSDSIKKNSEAEEKKLDELLSAALPVYVKMRNENVNDADEEVAFSKEHEENMKKLFENMKNGKNTTYHKSRTNIAKRLIPKVAIILIATYAMFGVFMPSNSAWKERITKFFVQDEGTGYSWVLYGDPDDLYDLRFGEKNDGKSYKISFLKYLPKGYTISKITNTSKSKYIKVENNSSRICLKITMALSNVLDNEETENDIVEINNRKIYYCQKDEEITFSWNDNEMMYNLYGNIEYNELVRIIENIDYEEIDRIFEKK